MDTAVDTAVPRSNIDPYAIEALENPHRFDGELREIGPVVYLEKWGIYAITGYQEIQKALRDWRTFSSTSRPFYKPNAFRPTILVLEDPPGHTQSKAAVTRLFSPENMAWIEGEFRAEAERVVEELVANGPVEIDGYRDLAVRYVLKAFPDILGLPEDGRELLLKFGDAVFNTAGPDSELQREKFASAAPAVAWVESNTVRDVQTEGRLGAQVYKQVDDGKISEETAQQILKSIFAAGFDTTVASISAMLRAFADNPDEWTKLRENPELIPNAFEETIRYYPAARFGGRLVMKDTEVAGVHIPPGANVLLMLLAAGRDPGKYENPDEFRVDRDLTGGHLSFGFGIHTCAGQAIARIEARALLDAMVKRIVRIDSVGEPRQAVNYQAFAHEYVPVRLTPA